METPGTPSVQEQPGGPAPSLPPADWTTQPAAPPPPAGWPPPPPTSAGPAPGWRYGGFWRRLVAFIVDGIILAIVLAPFARPIVAVGPDGVFNVDYGTSGIQTLLNAIYFIALWTLRGQTIGMMLLGLRVVRQSDGGPIDFVTALIRYVMLIVGFAVILLGVIWVAFDGRKRGWHDMVAKTYVIRPA